MSSIREGRHGVATRAAKSSTQKSRGIRQVYSSTKATATQSVAKPHLNGTTVPDALLRDTGHETSPIMLARLEYAERGWWTFPAPVDGPELKKSLKWACEKTNYVNWGATINPEIIRKEFRSRKYRDQNIGIKCGIESGIFVIETDTAEHGKKTDGAASLKAWEKKYGKLPDTLKARSPSGSIHRFFNHPGPGIKIKSFNAIFGEGSGVDCKGDGGMVIGVPSCRPASPATAKKPKVGGVYKWINADHPIADAPQWLLDVVVEKQAAVAEQQASKRNSYQEQRDQTRNSGWAAAALKEECRILAVTPEGKRNQQLNTSAFCLGQIVGGGGLKESEVIVALMTAAEANGSVKDDGKAVCRKTINSGLKKGQLKPRTAPHDANNEAAAIKAAVEDTKHPAPGKDSNVGVNLADFYALMPTHDYIFTPSREAWPASSVNAQIEPVQLFKKNGKPMLDENGETVFIKASTWLDQNRPVEMMTWAPGLPLVVPDRLISDGGWIERKGVATFNLYRPPDIVPGDAKKAKPWLDLVRKVYPNPDDADEILNFFAHRRQKPEQKINHGLVMGGEPGVGKDTIIEGVKQSVGPWNLKEVSPQDVMGQHNDFMRSTVLRISEVRDLGDVNRFSFYDHMKTVTATPPDVTRVNAKYLPQHYVLNVTGVIFTTNYKTNGIYLPADDRRTYVAWSDAKQTDFPEGHWLKFWHWYQHQDGLRHVAAYLAARDISGFDAKAPPKKTAAFWAIVDANAAPEEGELADTLDRIGAKQNIDAVTIRTVINHAGGEFLEWLNDRKNRRAIPHRFEKCGFVPVRSETDDGLWVLNGKRQVIYVRKELSLKEQYRAAQKLVKKGSV